ncbi:MAG TPA: hypothetical protein VK850_03405 [Candidatus Binatia bacterium]|nr:hypothetical protein [Candidatus Binatia bacterium]
MRAARRKGQLVLQFGTLEKEILLQTVDTILQNYKLKPADLDPRTAAVWYSTRGCKNADMSEDDTREWVETLYGFKGANARLLERCCAQIKEIEPDKFELAIKLADAAGLVTVINDHRLHLAAIHDIGQSDMDNRGWVDEEEQLPSEKESALVQIELLGWLIEVILRLTAPEAASWSELLEPPDELA